MSDIKHSNAEDLLKVGTLLGLGRYRIIRHLASGGFGNTYEALNLAFEKRCAIKEFFMKGITLRSATSDDVSIAHPANKRMFNEQKKKFKKEARRLNDIDNYNIIKVYDLFEENSTVYYVMDYVEGENLSRLMKKTGEHFSRQLALIVLDQMLNALEYIHSKGIWHMDIKPANILMDERGKCTLIDFGASKQTERDGGMTTSTAMAYTPGFAPSEQVGGQSDRWGPWTDIYALGATLYNLVTGESPAKLDVEEDEEEAFSFPPGVTLPVANLIVWMMRPKRKDRPQSVKEIRQYLLQEHLDLADVPEEEVVMVDDAAPVVVPETNTETEQETIKNVSFPEMPSDERTRNEYFTDLTYMATPDEIKEIRSKHPDYISGESTLANQYNVKTNEVPSEPSPTEIPLSGNNEVLDEQEDENQQESELLSGELTEEDNPDANTNDLSPEVSKETDTEEGPSAANQEKGSDAADDVTPERQDPPALKRKSLKKIAVISLLTAMTVLAGVYFAGKIGGGSDKPASTTETTSPTDDSPNSPVSSPTPDTQQAASPSPASDNVDEQATQPVTPVEPQRKAETKKTEARQTDANRKAEADRKAKADAEAKRKAESDARLAAQQAEARRKAEAEAKRKADADAEARRKAEADRKAKADAEARRKAEADARLAAQQAEARRKAEAEAKRKAEADAKRKADEEIRAKKAKAAAAAAAFDFE